MNAVLGQYVDLDTFLHRLHPMTKIIALVCFMLVTLLFSNLTLYLVQLAALILLLLVTKMPVSILGKSLWSVRFIFIFISIFNLLFLRDGVAIWQWGFLAIYPGTFIITINLVLRLLLLTSFAALLTLTTKPLDLTYAIEQNLRPLENFAHIIGMILAIALRFIPTLQEEAQKIMKAQQSRGARFDSGNIFSRAKHLVSLLIPLFLISFNRAEVLAMAMELRGYDPDGQRTSFRTLVWQKQDMIVITCMILYTLSAIGFKIIYGG